ncbi:MAG: hypothetical protein ACREBC_30285, partial [Pyrinomonadaceae bacterium]
CDCSISLCYTPCNFGGQRPWFVCPGWGCGRRVATLYAAGSRVLCRNCLGLSYPSQREDAGDRALRRAQRIRMKLGGSPNMTLPFPPKPKWMRWETYWRLRTRADNTTQRYLLALAERFKLRV